MRSWHLILLAAAGLALGCDGKALEGTVPVTGTVTYKGQPVEGATVNFQPTGEHRAASGLTDANGQYKLTTLSPEDGAMPGKYNVTISKTEITASRPSGDAPPETATPQYPPLTATEHLPVKYKKNESSGLTATVTAGGENDFPFELAD